MSDSDDEERAELKRIVLEHQAHAMARGYWRITYSPEGLRALANAGAHMVILSGKGFGRMDTTLTPEHERELDLGQYETVEYIRPIEESSDE